MAAVTEEFISKLFAAQQVERKKENTEFKEEIQVMISEGIKSEVEKATERQNTTINTRKIEVMFVFSCSPY